MFSRALAEYQLKPKQKSREERIARIEHDLPELCEEIIEHMVAPIGNLGPATLSILAELGDDFINAVEAASTDLPEELTELGLIIPDGVARFTSAFGQTSLQCLNIYADDYNSMGVPLEDREFPFIFLGTDEVKSNVKAEVREAFFNLVGDILNHLVWGDDEVHTGMVKWYNENKLCMSAGKQDFVSTLGSTAYYHYVNDVCETPMSAKALKEMFAKINCIVEEKELPDDIKVCRKGCRKAYKLTSPRDAVQSLVLQLMYASAQHTRFGNTAAGLDFFTKQQRITANEFELTARGYAYKNQAGIAAKAPKFPVAAKAAPAAAAAAAPVPAAKSAAVPVAGSPRPAKAAAAAAAQPAAVLSKSQQKKLQKEAKKAAEDAAKAAAKMGKTTV